MADPLNLDGLPVMPIEKSPRNNVKARKVLIATFYVLLLFLLMALGSIFLYRRMTKFEHLEDWELDCPRRFRYWDLYKATNGFKESEIIGIGGFGTVYRGVIPTNVYRGVLPTNCSKKDHVQQFNAGDKGICYRN